MYNLRHIISFIYSFNLCLITALFNANIPNNTYIEHFDKRKERKAPIKKSEKAPSAFTLASIYDHSNTTPRPQRKRPKAPKNSPKTPLNHPHVTYRPIKPCHPPLACNTNVASMLHYIRFVFFRPMSFHAPNSLSINANHDFTTSSCYVRFVLCPVVGAAKS